MRRMGEIDWAELECASGSAKNVPMYLARAGSDDPELASDAIYELYASLVNKELRNCRASARRRAGCCRC